MLKINTQPETITLQQSILFKKGESKEGPQMLITKCITFPTAERLCHQIIRSTNERLTL